jgi:hypothetical protein
MFGFIQNPFTEMFFADRVRRGYKQQLAQQICINSFMLTW